MGSDVCFRPIADIDQLGHRQRMAEHYPPLMLHVGLSSWIISDGNYADFKVGEARSFALEYYNEAELRSLPKSRATRSFERLEGFRYAVAGRILHLTSEWVAIDVGVPAYRELYSLPPPPRRFEGVVWLGVDPFHYFERRSREPGAPPLICDWRIRRIEVETAPCILKDGMMIYDPDRLHPKEVQDTRDGEDFVLHCKLLLSEPRHSLARS